MTGDTFRKHDDHVPAGFFAAEAAGLAWLAQAGSAGGARVVPVVDSGPHHIELARLTPVMPSPRDAEEFGRALARTHAAGATRHGAPPPGVGGSGFIATLRLEHDAGTGGEGLPWGAFYARYRVAPFARAAANAGSLDPGTVRAIDRLCERLDAGDEDLTGPAQAPARLHGDLWSGNVMWTRDGAVLIDPAAHGGHRETDLAMLELFGLPHLPTVLAAYDEAAPFAPGRAHRVGLHQLHPLLVHAVLFGGSYARQVDQVVARYA